jgi:OOP family OmpA-OmpF porin
MNILFKLLFSGLLMLSFSLPFNAQDSDAEGCKDHTMFNRMPGFYIAYCADKKFDGYEFFTGKYDVDENKIRERVEGKYYEISYYCNSEDITSALEILRNYENALKKAGAKILHSDILDSYDALTAVMKNGDMETWFELNDCIDGRYGFVIVQKQIMEQVIQADEMYEALNKDGFIALDILFDTGKSTIKEESLSLIDQIYNLLNINSDLKISIEGHTDNTGTPEGNKKLSQDRAKAVMDALITKGISKDRMSFAGFGQEAPIADNRTEDGRAKNRRVEIVKK